jgi:hypothetical protein
VDFNDDIHAEITARNVRNQLFLNTATHAGRIRTWINSGRYTLKIVKVGENGIKLKTSSFISLGP